MIFMTAISTNYGMKQAANPGSAAQELEHWTRLNYGVVATKVRTVCLVEAYVTHTVRIQLPTPVELNITVENTTTPCDAVCMRLRQIAEVTQNFVSTTQLSITEMTQRIYSLLPNISEKYTSFEKGK
jgi:hypothetical protein